MAWAAMSPLGTGGGGGGGMVSVAVTRFLSGAGERREAAPPSA